MITKEAVQERIKIPLDTETLAGGRVAYLEGLVAQAKRAAAVFTQFTRRSHC